MLRRWVDPKWYPYPDPYLCNCVFVGKEAEFQKYQQLKLQQQMVEQERAVAAMNENAAEAEQFNWMMCRPAPFSTNYGS